MYDKPLVCSVRPGYILFGRVITDIGNLNFLGRKRVPIIVGNYWGGIFIA